MKFTIHLIKLIKLIYILISNTKHSTMVEIISLQIPLHLYKSTGSSLAVAIHNMRSNSK